MARKTPSRTLDAAPTGGATGDDAQDLFGPWFESQRDLFGAGLDQLAQTQHALLKAWLGMLDQTVQAWQAPIEGGLRLASGGTEGDGSSSAGWIWPTPDAAQFVPQLVQAWWAPWVPFLQRGGEQLG